MATSKTTTPWQPSADPKNLRLSPEAASRLVDSAKAATSDAEAAALHGRMFASQEFLNDEIGRLVDHVTAEGREAFASESRTLAEMDAALNRITAALQPVAPPEIVFGSAEPNTTYAKGQPLAKGQSFAGFARAQGHDDGLDEFDDLNLSLGKIIRGCMTGDWRNAGAERTAMNAMTGGTGSAGGFLIPTTLSGQIIDLARAKTQVIEAGAQVVPMETRTVDVAKWVSDPALGWRAENDPIGESDATLGKLTLSARSIGTVVRVSRELVEDTDIASALTNAFAAALAIKVDNAALYGAGTTDPAGVKVNASVTKTSLGANGASPTYDAFVDSVGRLRDANEDPTGQIIADRTARTLAKLKDTAGNYLTPPAYLEGVPRLVTSGVPVNLTVGSSSDTSDVFTGDWRQLIIGIKTDLVIVPLGERYMTTNSDSTGGQYGFLAWWRGDIAVARPKAFDVVTGVRP